MILKYRNVGFPQHLPEDLPGDVGLVIPRDRNAEAAKLIVPGHARVEFEGVAADDFLLAEVGEAQTSGNHAAEMGPGLNQCSLQSLARRTYSRDHAAGGSTVDDDIHMARRKGGE